MDKKGNKLFGFFGEQVEIQGKIEELRLQDYSSENMYVIAKDNEQINALRSYSEVHFSTEQDGEWIDKFKEMFAGDHSLKNVFEEMGFSNNEAEQYNRRIENGEIFLFVDDEASDGNEEDMEISSTVSSLDEVGKNMDTPKMSRSERRRNLSGNEEKSLYLHEEQLEVHKERVQSGEINVNKRIVEEHQHMDVPVEREEVVVERRPMADNGDTNKEIQREPYHVGDELHIPVVEEKLVVTKKEVVTEEIIITKKRINDTERISETVRREEVDIDEKNLPRSNNDKK